MKTQSGSNPSSKETNEQPLVALIGPTNAGKSTLFNRLTGSWQAVTTKEESTTRDRIYGEVEWQGQRFTLVDTGGLAEDDSDLYKRIHSQTVEAVNEADLILFVYDAAAGLSDRDRLFLNSLRGRAPMWLVANKVDSFSREKKIERLENAGLPYHEVSAISGRGSGDLLEDICNFLPRVDSPKHAQPIIALVGRPNVGKSSLLNALVAEERAVVSPVAGTTRDVVTAELELNGQKFLLADTAGVRRRGAIEAGAEKFSVKRTLSAIEQANGVLVLLDAIEGTTRGDLHLIYYAYELKKPILLVFNKIDLAAANADLRFHHHLAKFEQVQISALKKDNIHAVAEWLKNLESKPKNS